MSRRMHSRSLLFFEKALDIEQGVWLIVENFKSYNSIILNTAGSENGGLAWYVEIPIIPGNTTEVAQYDQWDFKVYTEGDNLEIWLKSNGPISYISGLAIWGVK